jgi:uncharacterized protein involved in exopolysaccharide biosynthesis
VRRLAAQRADLVRRIEERAVEVRPQVAVEMAGRQGQSSTANPMVLRMRREMIGKQIAEASKEFDQVAKEVTALGNANADIEARRNEIAQLQAVTNQMGIQLNASEVDIAMPNRVELIEEANVPGEGDRMARALLSMVAGLAGFGLGFGGVVLMEYQRERLAVPGCWEPCPVCHGRRSGPITPKWRRASTACGRSSPRPDARRPR